MPDIDLWTVDASNVNATPDKQVESLAINFGAPGDRRQADGQLWMEYPPVAGESAPLKVTVNPDTKYFQNHSSLISGVDRPWVLASGVDNITDLEIKLRIDKNSTLDAGSPVEHVDDDVEEFENGEASANANRYDVRMHFAALPLDQGGERVFDVYVQDKLVLSDVTIKPTGSVTERYTAKLLEDVAIADKLKIRFVPKQGKAALAGIEVVKRSN